MEVVIISPFFELFDLLLHPIGRLARLTIIFVEKTPIHDCSGGLFYFIGNGLDEKICQLLINAWTIWRKTIDRRRVHGLMFDGHNQDRWAFKIGLAG